MKLLLWIVFLAVFTLLYHKDTVLKSYGNNKGIVSLELSKKDAGVKLITNWRTQYYGDDTLIKVAQDHTRLDFFYILIYVSLLMVMSNWQMQRENQVLLNELLRFNFFIVVIAGVLDVIENFRMLHNFHHVNDASTYLSINLLAFIKFILLTFSVFIFLISMVKSLIWKSGDSKKKLCPAGAGHSD
jgi:hypothetical protein